MKDMFKMCLDCSYRVVRSYIDVIYWNGRCSGWGGYIFVVRFNIIGNLVVVIIGNLIVIILVFLIISIIIFWIVYFIVWLIICFCFGIRLVICGGCNFWFFFFDIVDNFYFWRDLGFRKCFWLSWLSCVLVDDNRI